MTDGRRHDPRDALADDLSRGWVKLNHVEKYPGHSGFRNDAYVLSTIGFIIALMNAATLEKATRIMSRFVPGERIEAGRIARCHSLSAG
jgi:hypothetical protein